MAKINLMAVEMLQMNGKTEVMDLREDVCKVLYFDREKEMVMLGQRLWQGETELSPDEEKIIRQMIDPWPWITRDAIERQLSKK